MTKLDVSEAKRIIRFVSALKLVDDYHGEPFCPSKWQKKILVDLFALKNDRNLRQYRDSFIFIPRKNAKSTLIAAMVLYFLMFGGDDKQIYSAANSREQARVVFDIVMKMIHQDPYLASKLTIRSSTSRIYNDQTGSVYKAISAEAANAHGLNPALVIYDEIHEAKTTDLYDALTSGSGTRKEPLFIAITTAGFDKESLCYRLYDHAKQVSQGIKEDPTHYPVIYEMNEGADWSDEKNWKQANPALDDFLDITYLRQNFIKAKDSYSEMNKFKRLHLNIWTDTETAYIPPEKWDMCDFGIDLSTLEGKICFVGVDLSQSSDISASVLLFPPQPGVERYTVIPHFYIPKEGIDRKSKQDRVSYRDWVDKGLITATPGETVDYDYIFRDVVNFAEKYNVHSVVYDRYHALQIIRDFEQEGFQCIAHGQNPSAMTAPTKEVEKQILDTNFNHFGNPVLRWMNNNMVVSVDSSGNVKPDKGKSAHHRIDGMVAMIMAMGGYLAHEKELEFAYKDRGFRSL